jgi:LuxR family transcriptional regulator, maltose regulon positive regulatory protein
MEPVDMDFHDLLFRTKLNIPFGNKSVVLRSRIMDELDKALTVKLTLITAPAGFGKTTAVANWAMQSGIPTAWFSIDSHDNSVKKFWSYVIAALETVIPGLAGRFSQYLHTSDNFTAEGLVAALVEEISKFDTDFILILDDYHLIQDGTIHESLSMLIKYMPSNAHVIISGRSKPPFVSSRFEISGEL